VNQTAKELATEGTMPSWCVVQGRGGGENSEKGCLNVGSEIRTTHLSFGEETHVCVCGIDQVLFEPYWTGSSNGWINWTVNRDLRQFDLQFGPNNYPLLPTLVSYFLVLAILKLSLIHFDYRTWVGPGWDSMAYGIAVLCNVLLWIMTFRHGTDLFIHHAAPDHDLWACETRRAVPVRHFKSLLWQNHGPWHCRYTVGLCWTVSKISLIIFFIHSWHTKFIFFICSIFI
jgi:hypothetical protein